MKGFLSFLGITLIAMACAAILFSFYGNPLEDLKLQERQLAYQEMRANHSAAAAQHTISQLSIKNSDDTFTIGEGQSCSRASFEQ